MVDAPIIAHVASRHPTISHTIPNQHYLNNWKQTPQFYRSTGCSSKPSQQQRYGPPSKNKGQCQLCSQWYGSQFYAHNNSSIEFLPNHFLVKNLMTGAIMLWDHKKAEPMNGHNLSIYHHCLPLLFCQVVKYLS